MLNQITNINPNSEFNKSPREEHSSKKVTRASRKVEKHLDEASLSPAVVFLNKINWKLIEFKQISKDKLSIKFRIGDIVFSTQIDLPDIYNLTEISFIVNNVNTAELQDNLLIIKFNTFLFNVEEKHNESEYVIEGLNLFFKGLKDFVINNPGKEFNEFAQTLLMKLKYQVEKDFFYINGNLKIFLEKLLEVKIIPRKKNNPELQFINISL